MSTAKCFEILLLTAFIRGQSTCSSLYHC